MKRAVGILSGILAFAAILFGIVLLLTAIGWPITTEGLQKIAAGSRRMPTLLFLILTALVCITIGVVVLYGMIGNRLNRRTSALLEKNSLGETAVSFAALSQIVDRTLKNRKDVKSFKTRVYAIGSSIRIEVRAVTSPTVSLLELTHSLQDEIHAAIVALCGIPIGSIDVTVDQTELLSKKLD